MNKSINGIKGPDKENFLDLAPKQAGKTNNGKKAGSPIRQLSKSKKLIAFALVGLLAIAGVWLVALRGGGGELTNQQVIDKVSSLVTDLPTETPTIATIEDAEAIVQTDAFYTGSGNGDKVLVYPQSKRAIIYSPDNNTIVKDGSVSGAQ